MLFVGICGSPICFISNNALVFFLLWLLFFVGGIIVPMCTGVMLAVVEPELRP